MIKVLFFLGEKAQANKHQGAVKWNATWWDNNVSGPSISPDFYGSSKRNSVTLNASDFV